MHETPRKPLFFTIGISVFKSCLVLKRTGWSYHSDQEVAQLRCSQAAPMQKSVAAIKLVFSARNVREPTEKWKANDFEFSIKKDLARNSIQIPSYGVT